MNFLNTMNDTTQGNKSRQSIASGNFQRFIVLAACDDHDHDLSKLSPFVIEKFLKANIGTLDELDWIEQGLTSHQTHYRSYRGRVFTGQMTQPTVSKH